MPSYVITGVQFDKQHKLYLAASYANSAIAQATLDTFQAAGGSGGEIHEIPDPVESDEPEEIETPDLIAFGQ